MCDCEPTHRMPAEHTRRAVLALAASGAAATLLAACGQDPTTALAPARSRVEVAPGLAIHPRDEWGADLPPTGPIMPEDVRFLLVHHTASSNSYRDPRDVIRATYAWQTSRAKGWPDVCYEFFVARDGSVWEGRAGALAGPVAADATGGSQGFAQLVCLIGDHSVEPPTPAAQDSLVRLLGWLAARYRLDTTPGAMVTFTSRGSDRYPAGSRITTAVISGHRDCTYTACPGDAAYRLLPTWRQQVHDTRPTLAVTPGAGPRPAVRLPATDP